MTDRPLLHTLRLFQLHNAPELLHETVVESGCGVLVAAAMTNVDEDGSRVGIEIGFAAGGCHQAEWIDDASGTRIWARASNDYFDDAVAGVVVAALSAMARRSLAPQVERVTAAMYDPAVLAGL